MRKNMIATIFAVLVIAVGCSSDTEPPEVSITSPSYGDTIDVHTITITADASDNKELEIVEFYIDNTLLGEDSTSPYENDWSIVSYDNMSAHPIYAKAYDLSENFNQSEVVLVTVKNRGVVSGENTDSAVVFDGMWAERSVAISGAPDQAVVDSITLTVTIYHLQPSDMDIYLRSPDNTEHQIWDNDFVGPTESFTTTYFADESVEGSWLLRIYDSVTNGLGGYLAEYKIDIYWKF